MAERNEAVVQRVRELLEKYPTLKSKQLLDLAVRMDPALEELSPRSFHARYVLPILRERARAEGRSRPTAERRRSRAAKKGGRKRTAGKDGRKAESGDTAAPGKGRAATAGRRGAGSDVEHARVREILLRYTRDVAGAGTRSDLVDLVGGIDAVVKEILQTG